MALVTNLENQLLILDFGEESLALLGKETKHMDDKYLEHPALELNKGSIQVTLTKEETEDEKISESEAKLSKTAPQKRK